jgi:putative SOS response-associated peptidase YedK
LASRPAWAESLRFRRAVVPVDGVWLWSRAGVEGEAPRPFLARAKSGEPMFLAALWQEGEDGRELALVTTEANRMLEPFGARMPAMLRGDDCAFVVGTWRGRSEDVGARFENAAPRAN